MKLAHAYDPLLHRHSLHVGRVVEAFTAFLGCSPQDQTWIVEASLLHDLGKICIAPSLINKPADLSAKEIENMRRHPEIGHAMLGAEIQDVRILDVVLHHHERLDGYGYPERMIGRELSDAVRVVAICDIYAAMTEFRPYGTPLSAQEALQRMQNMARRLDPELVDVFAKSEAWKTLRSINEGELHIF